MRKTRIVCTLGPACEKVEILSDLLKAGMNVARFNMAHGSHEYHAGMMARVREASRVTGIPVALMLDIKGPEIRTGSVEGGTPVEIASGAEVVVTAGSSPCTSRLITISYAAVAQQVSAGTRIFIADGLIDLEVMGVKGGEVRCVVRNGGILGSHKNVNIIGIRSLLPAVTEKDLVNLRFGAAQKMDYVAASFVRKPEDILEIRQAVLREGSAMHVIAKIEDPEGVANIDGIIQAADGIMVARGDLGVQLPTEQIPLVQKRLILRSHAQGKTVITATQMLDSMIVNPKPTRAEATDVANAIFDGSDAIMLSGETASGAHPVLAVRIMDRIARAAEESPEYESRMQRSLRAEDASGDTARTVARSAFLIARDIRAAAILTPTLRGSTPRLISRLRPSQPIIAVTPSEEVARKLLLYWGVIPLIEEVTDNTDAMLNNAMRAAMEARLVHKDDRVVILAGVPVNSPIMLNMVRVHIVGNVLAKGTWGFGGSRSGRIVKAVDAREAGLRLRRDGTEILLTRFLTPEFRPLLKGLNGIILEESSYLSEEEIEAEQPGIALVLSAPQSTSQLEGGLTVTIQGQEKTVYEGVVALPPSLSSESTARSPQA